MRKLELLLNLVAVKVVLSSARNVVSRNLPFRNPASDGVARDVEERHQVCSVQQSRAVRCRFSVGHDFTFLKVVLFFCKDTKFFSII